MIDKETTLFALLDDMANRSKRTKEFNDIFTSSNLNASYIPLNIRDDDILFTVNGLKKSQISGVNIGDSYKEEVLPILDSFSDEVKRCGFVNSVKIENGKLYGYITIGEAISSLFNGKIAIFGSDSLTKSILFNVKDISEITVIERYIEDAEDILREYPDLDIKFSDENHLFDNSNYSLVIDTTESEIFLKDNLVEKIELKNGDIPEKIRKLQNSIDIREWF